MAGYLRHPRTTQEHRANQDGDCRPARRPSHLPTVYDDTTRGDLKDRSWKRSRRAKYRRIADLRSEGL
jgi:hypothetical protein